MVDLGVAYVFPRVLRKKLHNCSGFLLQLLGHQQFSSVVTQSQTVQRCCRTVMDRFWMAQIVTQVTAVCMVHIQVTTHPLVSVSYLHCYA